jgi:hypothetical protein
MHPSQRLSNRIRRTLDALDDRIVPATVVDLTTHGATGAANGALFQQCDAQPTGTGVIRSFLRVQATGTEQGYNTDARPLTLDENKSPQFTRSLSLSQVPVVTIDGVAYRQFLLDINQSSKSPLLSLDELRLYVGATPTVTGYDATAHTLGGLDPVFDLDAGGDVTVQMNYRLNSGSGAGDVFVLVPDAAFANAPAGGFLYLYSKFSGGNAGFEEWAVKSTPDTTPIPHASSLSGFVYFDANLSGVRDAGDSGLAGIVMQLQGTDENGNTVVLTATTDANGFYQFTNLRAGSYSIFRTTDPTGPTPAGGNYLDGSNTAGSLGGTVQEVDATHLDAIVNITVGRDQAGVNYNFGFADDGSGSPPQ